MRAGKEQDVFKYSGGADEAAVRQDSLRFQVFFLLLQWTDSKAIGPAHTHTHRASFQWLQSGD